MELIRNHSAYCVAREMLTEAEIALAEERTELLSFGLSSEEVDVKLEAKIRHYGQLGREVQRYEDAVQGYFDLMWNLEDFGRMLIGLRIAKGVSERELAERLHDPNVDQVVSDERNEYRGVSLDRAQRILHVLRVHLATTVEILD